MSKAFQPNPATTPPSIAAPPSSTAADSKTANPAGKLKVGDKFPAQKFRIYDSETETVDEKGELQLPCVLAIHGGASCVVTTEVTVIPPEFTLPKDFGTNEKTPGIAGCTGASLVFHGKLPEFRARGVEPYLVSLQSVELQKLAVQTRGLKGVKCISLDPEFVKELGLPTHTDSNGTVYPGRVTLVLAADRTIERIFHKPATVANSVAVAKENAEDVANYVLAKPKLNSTATAAAAPTAASATTAVAVPPPTPK